MVGVSSTHVCALNIKYRNMLAPDPAYDAYVSEAGITGNDDFDVLGYAKCV